MTNTCQNCHTQPVPHLLQQYSHIPNSRKTIPNTMSTLPFYLLGLLLLAYSILTYASYIPSLYTYAFYRHKDPNSLTPNKQLTAALQYLVDAPTLGQFFYQDLIAGYVSTNQWQKVLNYSNLAIQSPINSNSFSIWYYKATAECLLSHLQECERSARIANSLSPFSNEDYVSQLFSLAQVMKGNKNVRLVSQKNQILVVLDDSGVGAADRGSKGVAKQKEKYKEKVQKQQYKIEEDVQAQQLHEEHVHQIESKKNKEIKLSQL